jgi:hypothetical protein
MSFLFTQCSNDKQLGFSDDIKKHFGDMKYREVIFPKYVGFNPKSDLQSIKGKGAVKDKLAKPINYSWYLITDDKGEIGGFYLGSDNSNSTGTVEMTKGEGTRRLRNCKAQGGDINECVAKVMTDWWMDCISSSTPEECEIHCWMNDHKCIE